MVNLPNGENTGHLIVFMNHPFWGGTQKCVTQFWVGLAGNVYARFKNNSDTMSSVAWKKLN